MTDSPGRTPARPTKVPVMGPLAREAMRVPLEVEQRKLLVLIAAYADAGERSPSIRELGARIGISISGRGHPPGLRKLEWLLRGLIREGRLRVRWRAEPGTCRNVYDVRVAPRKTTRAAA
jgi:hypothetical protein